MKLTPISLLKIIKKGTVGKTISISRYYFHEINGVKKFSSEIQQMAIS